MTVPITRFLWASVGLLAVGCGGPNYRFDPLPSPAWITQVTQVDGPQVRAVGITRATPQVGADADLAKRNGLQHIASSVQAKVVGLSGVWSAEAESGDTHEEREMVVSDVQIRTRLAVEGARVEAEYRDEASRSHYAMVTVDKSAWVEAVGGRLGTALNAVERATEKARAHLDAGRVFKALRSVSQAVAIGRKSGTDVTVIEVLAGPVEQVERASDLRDRVEGVNQALRDEVAFTVHVSGGTADAQSETRSRIETFIKEQGIRVAASAPRTVQVVVEIGHDAGRTQRVGSRVDHLVNARGSLRVTGADGREVSAMSFEIQGDRYQERHRDPAAAADAADSLAGHTLASQFRSRFRKLIR